MSLWTCECGSKNRALDALCEDCGATRPSGASERTAPSYCPLDGTPLHANGWCPTGDGYPVTLRQCPDVCDQCRRHLRWDGDCEACRPEGTKPGHLYDFDPVKAGVQSTGHWRIVERGPQQFKPPTSEQRATLKRALDVIEGRKRV